MADEISQTIDLFKVVGLILGGWGAGLSTYNFFSSHFTRLLIEFTPDQTNQTLGKIRILCLGRPRFVDEIVVRDDTGSIVSKEDIGKTLARGEGYRKDFAKNFLAKNHNYEIEVVSERNTFTRRFRLESGPERATN